MTTRVRRQPPPFRTVDIVATEEISPLMTRVIVGGPELAGFGEPTPAASVRLLLPSDGSLVIPSWEGNEFLLPDGRRPVIRTLTPRRFDANRTELHLDIVHHDGGALTPWVSAIASGDRSAGAVSGPGRGYAIDSTASGFLLIGDETAIPAICQLLEYLPDVPISAHIAIRDETARVDLHREVDERWLVTDAIDGLGPMFVDSIGDEAIGEGVRIWAAGEAAAMYAVRTHLFTELGVPRSVATVRGYWKHRETAD